MYVVIPAAFGIRMCLKCPDCSSDITVVNEEPDSCADFLGCNHKAMGGYAGLAAAMAIATEFQGNGTPHGHGYVMQLLEAFLSPTS